MKVGYGLITCQRHPEDARSDEELYDEALELASEAEALGFDSVWTSEHHFADDAYMPSLPAVSAAIAARTDRIEIGTGILLAPLHDPVRLAEDAATVDLISHGRFLLGLGMGWLDWEFEAFGVPMDERVPRLEEAVATCRAAWGEGPIASRGVVINPKPARGGGPSIWIGAGAERAIRRAARIADGWIAGEPTPAEFEEQVAWLRDEISERSAAAARQTPFEVAGYWPVFVWDDDSAWERVRPFFHYMEWKYEDAENAKGRRGALPSPPPLDEDGERELRPNMIAGTPAEVEAEVRERARIAGEPFTFVARLYYPGMPRSMMRRSTELFAREVLPRLRD